VFFVEKVIMSDKLNIQIGKSERRSKKEDE
jgi:hypothetical protein